MTIRYYIREVYGSVLNYIADPDVADLVSRLTGTKTLTSSQMQTMQKLGFQFIQVMREV